MANDDKIHDLNPGRAVNYHRLFYQAVAANGNGTEISTDNRPKSYITIITDGDVSDDLGAGGYPGVIPDNGSFPVDFIYRHGFGLIDIIVKYPKAVQPVITNNLFQIR